MTATSRDQWNLSAEGRRIAEDAGLCQRCCYEFSFVHVERSGKSEPTMLVHVPCANCAGKWRALLKVACNRFANATSNENTEAKT
jgi:hypothetical protein